ncbi:MAG: response regulator, partial [Lentisphaeria bacterium]|nr:response regulator [Lentisphaeria bacterium]NQZ70870.1 response regulator [Lentisphaeria bacterium]
MSGETIICADDDQVCRMIFQSYLSEDGYEIRLCASGEEVLEAMQVTDPDVLILDLHMEGLSGLETCNKVRSDPKYTDLPILIVSAADQKEDLKKSFLFGADEYIVKPIKKGELLGKIELLLSKKNSSIPQSKGLTKLVAKDCDFTPNSIFNGRYQIDKLLQSTSSNRMYRAYDMEFTPYKPVAIKIYDFSSVKSTDPKFLKRFLREGYQHSKLDHTNIVDLYDIGQYHGIYFIVMEYVQGNSLEYIIDKSGPMSQDTLLLIAYELNKAIMHLDENDIIHRDIKPANIMVNLEGDVKLLDFGLARKDDEQTLSSTDQFQGTPQVVSPEMIDDPANL